MKTTTSEVVEGVILKKTPYKENDMILHVYTKDFGKIGILARGVRKMTSKNARAVQEMMISEFEISLKKGLSTLIKATPLHYLRHIKESIEYEIVGNYILEYYYRYIEENKPSYNDYQMLISSLKALDEGYSYLLVYIFFQVYILQSNGIDIEVDGCVKCGDSKVVSISIEDGGFVCASHFNHSKLYSKETLQAFRHFHKLTIHEIDQFHVSDDVLKEIISIHEYYIHEYAGISLKSLTFIKQIV